MNSKVAIECKQCHQLFKPRNKKSSLCSNSCSGKWRYANGSKFNEWKRPLKPKVSYQCDNCRKEFLRHPSENNQKGVYKYCSKSCAMRHRVFLNPNIMIELTKKGNKARIGTHHSEETKKKLSKHFSGLGLEYSRKISEAVRKSGKIRKGKDCNFWKGGVTPINKKIRSSSELKRWRKEVFYRDDFTCQMCGDRGVTLNADHIKPFSLFPELRFDLDNGRTLCVPCHKETDTYLGKIKQYEKKLPKI